MYAVSVGEARYTCDECCPSLEPLVVDLGARLVGQHHYSPLRLRTPGAATIVLLTEEEWARGVAGGPVRGRGVLHATPFWWTPAGWRAGEGEVRGAAGCSARSPGLHTRLLRLLSSTGVTRRLQLLADCLMYAPKHLSIQVTLIPIFRLRGRQLYSSTNNWSVLFMHV